MDKNKDLPIVAQPNSIKIQVDAGKKYLWCACGLSKNQPFCDSSHIGTGILPIMHEATESKIVGFCGCKHTKHAPICDGSHKNLIVK